MRAAPLHTDSTDMNYRVRTVNHLRTMKIYCTVNVLVERSR